MKCAVHCAPLVDSWTPGCMAAEVAGAHVGVAPAPVTTPEKPTNAAPHTTTTANNRLKLCPFVTSGESDDALGPSSRPNRMAFPTHVLGQSSDRRGGRDSRERGLVGVPGFE